MVLLQSKDIFDDILQLDPLTGRTLKLKRSSSPELLDAPISGTFANIGGHHLLFYRFEGRLKFVVDEKEVEIDNQTRSSLERNDGQRIFRLFKEEKELLKFVYNIGDLEQEIPGDTTAFVESEDFDFCSFVHNVLNNPERKSFIYQTQQNSL